MPDPNLEFMHMDQRLERALAKLEADGIHLTDMEIVLFKMAFHQGSLAMMEEMESHEGL